MALSWYRRPAKIWDRRVKGMVYSVEHLRVEAT